MSEPTQQVRLVAYSDYLCPWCYNASVRLQRLEEQEPEVEVEWRSYLLRPRPGRRRDLDRFRAYTESWRRPGAEEDAGAFRIWASEEGPPSHSVPAQVAAKAAGELGRAAFRRFHDGLLRAYFHDSRDISRAEVLEALWDEANLPSDAFSRREDPALLRRVRAEHEEALRCGATGVPSVRLAEGDAVITGALPLATYLRWVERVRESRRVEA